MKNNKNTLQIIPIGGLEQIGANCTMIGSNGEWIVVDLGVSFYDKLGVEVLTPDITYLNDYKKDIKGIFITHAHEDHIGAIGYLWQLLKCPVYLTEFPAAVLKQKISGYQWSEDVPINIVNKRQRINVGNFEIEFVGLSHSVLGACGLYIKTPHGNVFHTGDWKIDEKPLLGDLVDTERLIEIGKEGVDCLLCDSTNMLTESLIGSESTVRDALERVIAKYDNKRVTVTCFSSNVARIETIFYVARKLKRRVAIIGRSMYKMLDAVAETSYYTPKFRENVNSILSDEEAMSLPPEKVLLICTGSQGEARSALYKLAKGENKIVKLGGDDVVIFSSKVIPGNEIGIRDLQNMLLRQNVEIVTTDMEADIHVSGHPNKAAVAQMYSWIKPKTLMPVHGDARMLYAQQAFAKHCGISEVLVAESGDVISYSDGKLEKVSHRDMVFNAVDGNDVIPLNSIPLRDRNVMTYNGHVSVSFVLSNDEIVDEPMVTVQGINTNKKIEARIKSAILQITRNEVAKGRDVDILKREITYAAKKYMVKNFNKKPLIAVHIHQCV